MYDGDNLALKVSAANGNEMVYTKVCIQFHWCMQGYQFQEDFLILPLHNYDMILGIQWLDYLGDIIWKFNKLQMKFHIDD